MAGLPELNYDLLSTLLTDLQDHTNEKRQAAEKSFIAYREATPNELLLGLLKVVKEGSQVHFRQHAAVCIRNMLRDFILRKSDSVWTNLTPSTKAILKQELLSALVAESNRTARRSICDTVSDLATQLISSNEWPELGAHLMTMIESNVTASQASGLRILSDLVPQMSSTLRKNPAAIERFATACASSSEPEVVYECLSFVTSLVQSEPKKVWKYSQSCLPSFIKHLVELVKSGEEDLANEILFKFVEIADSESGYFKPHMLSLVDVLLYIARSDASEEVQQMAVETLLCMAEDKPQMCVKVDKFISNVVDVLMELMLTVEHDDTWIDSEGDKSEDEPTRNYDIGEAGLDRLGGAVGGDALMPVLFEAVEKFLRAGDWAHKFVAIISLSQTVEYLPEDNVELHLMHLVEILLANLKDPHHRVRFAVCQAIGQISLDHQPLFQKNHAREILPAISNAIDDESPRVQSHAAAALINFAEEVEKQELLPFSDSLMEKLFRRIVVAAPRSIREQSITAIAVVAGVLEKDFVKYYATVVPAMKEVISHSAGKDDRALRGKAIECISIIGLSVGSELFDQDGHEVMRALLEISKEEFDGDDPVREYVQEALCRMCRTMGAKIVPYLAEVMPKVMKQLDVIPVDVDDGEDKDEEEDMTIVSVAEGKYCGLKTSVIQQMGNALLILDTFIEVLGPDFRDFIAPSFEALLPLLDFKFSDDIKRQALSAVAELFGASRKLVEEKGGEGRQSIAAGLHVVLRKVFSSLMPSDEEADVPDLDLMVADAGGLSKCLKNAGPGVLVEEDARVICENVFALMQESSNRRAEIVTRKMDPDFDEEDVEKLGEEENSEQLLRSTLLEIIANLMVHHPDLYAVSGAPLCLKFIQEHIHPSCTADDRALALYVCDDVLEHLKDQGAPMWPVFAVRMIESLNDEDPGIRQAAAYGIIQAAKCPSFPSDLIKQAAVCIANNISSPVAESKENRCATDNMLAAMGSLIVHRQADLQPLAESYVKTWVDKLPLKADDEEGRNAHTQLMDLVMEGKPLILGPERAYVPKLAAIFAEIYRTEFSTAALDKRIIALMQSIGFETVAAIGADLAPKIQRGFDRIHRDVSTPTAASA